MKSMAQLRYHFGIILRCYPSNNQRRAIKDNSNASRAFYNHLIAVQHKQWYLRHTFSWNQLLNLELANQIRKECSQKWFKNHEDWLRNDKDIDSLALANAEQNNRRAWKNYQDGLQRVPAFHAKKLHPYEDRYQTNCLYHKNKNGKHVGSVRLLDMNHIRLPKLGRIRVKHTRSFLFKKQYRIGTVTIYKNSQNEFYISLQLASDKPFVVFNQGIKRSYHKYGLDLNVSNFLMDSNGNVVPNPKFYTKALPRLRRLQKRVSRRYRHAVRYHLNLRSDKNYQKARKQVSKLENHIKLARKCFLQRISTRIIENQDFIVAENLRSKNMLRNHKLAQRIQDVGWRSFLAMLSYKAKLYHKTFIMINPAYTTQQCYNCGYICNHLDGTHLSLNDRMWVCPRCGKVHIRDINAAKNIKRKGLNWYCQYMTEFPDKAQKYQRKHRNDCVFVQ